MTKIDTKLSHRERAEKFAPIGSSEAFVARLEKAFAEVADEARKEEREKWPMSKHRKLSKKFKDAIKTCGVRIYKLAQEADLNPNTLYKFVSDIALVDFYDKRIRKIANRIGIIEADIFESEDANDPDQR